ncbi:MAG TPA: pyridoxamine 5'-phosphate oxidase family protein [Chloroflexia bacterium]|nr:pyridoxamine 5'-phosphate oxidase family protein [Chloroflexia bacterium]
MPPLRLPPEVEAVLGGFFTCEFTTLTRQSQPLTWPTLPYYDQAAGRLIITVSIAFPVKAENARRNPHVAMLFSDPTGSGLSDPPAVLVQGEATVQELLEATPWSWELFRVSSRRQPDSRKYLANPLTRRLFSFYFQRIALLVQPREIYVWPHRDFTRPPDRLGVQYVE